MENLSQLCVQISMRTCVITTKLTVIDQKRRSDPPSRPESQCNDRSDKQNRQNLRHQINCMENVFRILKVWYTSRRRRGPTLDGLLSRHLYTTGELDVDSEDGVARSKTPKVQAPSPQLRPRWSARCTGNISDLELVSRERGEKKR